jgi:hypothetical protein
VVEEEEEEEDDNDDDDPPPSPRSEQMHLRLFVEFRMQPVTHQFSAANALALPCPDKRDVSGGAEPVAIPWENSLDQDEPPKFLYITRWGGRRRRRVVMMGIGSTRGIMTSSSTTLSPLECSVLPGCADNPLLVCCIRSVRMREVELRFDKTPK